jgi:AmmeMemoRadiSam system protein A
VDLKTCLSKLFFLRYFKGFAEWTMLKAEEKRELLKIARDAVESLSDPAIHGNADAAVEESSRPGLFVTIRLDGKLRGCVGLIQTSRTLTETVRELAKKAAFEDPRFPPMTPLEIKSASFEVSILTELQPLNSIEEIEVGVHGVVVESGHHKGLLLPQVACEFGWDRQQLISALLQKANLNQSAITDPSTRFSVFHTEHLKEEG